MRIQHYTLEDETVTVISETPIAGFTVLSTSRPFSGRFKLDGYDNIWLVEGMYVKGAFNNLVFDSNYKEHSGSYSTGAGPINFTIALYDSADEMASIDMVKYGTAWPVTVTVMFSIRAHAITKWQLALCYSSFGFPLPWPYAETHTVFPFNTLFMLGLDADFSSFYVRGVIDTSSILMAPGVIDESTGLTNWGWNMYNVNLSALSTPELSNILDMNLCLNWPQNSPTSQPIVIRDGGGHDIFSGNWIFAKGAPADIISLARGNRGQYNMGPLLHNTEAYNAIGIKISSYLIDPLVSDDFDGQFPLAELVVIKNY